MNTWFAAKKKRPVRAFLIITGLIVLSVAVLSGLFCCKGKEIRVVKNSYENGMDKEVWLYKRNIFNKEKKIGEITYYRNGNRESEIDYKKGAVNGWARLYYKSGKLHVEATYKNNRTHGVRKAYYENGQLFCRAEYKNGKLLRRKNWDEDGKEIYIDMERP